MRDGAASLTALLWLRCRRPTPLTTGCGWRQRRCISAGADRERLPG
ncbi:hypothetical protein M8494_36070 [Serratia ureilytica]